MANYLCRYCDHFNRFEEVSNLKYHLRSTHFYYMYCISESLLEHLTKYCSMNVSEKNISKLFKFY